MNNSIFGFYYFTFSAFFKLLDSCIFSSEFPSQGSATSLSVFLSQTLFIFSFIFAVASSFYYNYIRFLWLKMWQTSYSYLWGFTAEIYIAIYLSIYLGLTAINTSCVVGHQGWLAGYQATCDLGKSALTKVVKLLYKLLPVLRIISGLPLSSKRRSREVSQTKMFRLNYKTQDILLEQKTLQRSLSDQNVSKDYSLS